MYSRNPLFPNQVIRYELTPDQVDCVVFCSKNYEPILNDLTGITSKFNTYFHYTITAYGEDMEPGVPSIEKSMEILKQLSAIVGKQRVAWRYDPDSPLLLGHLKESDMVWQGTQKTYQTAN